LKKNYRTPLKKFQSHFEFSFSTTLCLKKLNQTLLKNFQSTPQPLIEIQSQINQTLPGNKKTRSVSDPFNRNGEKPLNPSDVNPL